MKKIWNRATGREVQILFSIVLILIAIMVDTEVGLLRSSHRGQHLRTSIYFIFSSETNAYQKQIKVVSITSEIILVSVYIFTVAFMDYL